MDILAHEQLAVVKKVTNYIEQRDNHGRRIEVEVFKNGFHGWLDCAYRIPHYLDAVKFS